MVNKNDAALLPLTRLPTLLPTVVFSLCCSNISSAAVRCIPSKLLFDASQCIQCACVCLCVLYTLANVAIILWQVFTGLWSRHDNGREDRIFTYRSCEITCPEGCVSSLPHITQIVSGHAMCRLLLVVLLDITVYSEHSHIRLLIVQYA
jgi:hypothetical protein